MKLRLAGVSTLSLSLLVWTCLLAGTPGAHARAQQSPETFASFWTKFKTALAKNDRETVASLTKLPFPYDNGELARAQFIKKYDVLFDRPLKRCLARARPIRDGDSYSVFCGEQGLFFERVGGRYKFTNFFAND